MEKCSSEAAKVGDRHPVAPSLRICKGGKDMKKFVSGNQAIALGALAAGVKIVTGYPGTPSSEVIGSLYEMTDIPETHVEWSTNEKVAVEVAAAAAWAGHRTMSTMKMSGLNVAYDALIGFAYSGTNGGYVVYVTDDPGVTTGMCEQDCRGFALMSDMVMLEPATVQECYTMMLFAFDLSEEIGRPVFVRGVTNVSQSNAMIEIGERQLPKEIKPIMEKDIQKYTKAGAVIAQNQHHALIAALDKAQGIIAAKGINKLKLGKDGSLGIISVGVVNCYIDEAIETANSFGADIDHATVSKLQIGASVPYPVKEMQALLDNCSQIVVLEELEPYIEKQLYLLAYQMGVNVDIIGKMDSVLSRVGEFDSAKCARALLAACGKSIPGELTLDLEPTKHCAARPITTCAGCPHRGTFLALNQAIKNRKLKKDEVMVTGDIGCTILGMNPPFHSVWTEVAMGSSIAMAHGYKLAGLETPVIATIGDSTFFHAGMPPLINALQQNIDITVIIMDNGWTGMTGMQINPGTATEFQREGSQSLQIVETVRGMGVEHLFVCDPYDLSCMTDIIEKCFDLPGVKVIVARRECAIQSNRRNLRYNQMKVDPEKCKRCKVCINVSGCPAIELGEKSIIIDHNQCNGCSICSQLCKFGAIEK
jgi:indolepyruvate ferredoxin oxidoreductase alpha subunit